jgi:PAS domain S-box-containing protein
MEKSKTKPGTTILLVEDDHLLNKSIQNLLLREGFTTKGFLNGTTALERMSASSGDVLLLLDYSLPDMTGKEVIAKMRERGLDIPFIIITGHGDEQLAVEMMKLGALDYIVKSIQFHEVVPAKVRRACEEIAGKRKLARAEEGLMMAAAEWQKTFDSIADAVFIIDSDQRIVRCNQTTLRLLGKPVEEVIGSNCCKAIHGADKPIENCPVVQMKRSLTREYGEMALDDHWYSITADPIVDSSNVLAGAVHVISDITERKRAEQALRESEEHYRLLYELESDAIVVVDEAGGDILEVNKAAIALYGYSNEEWLTMKNTDVSAEPDNTHKATVERFSIIPVRWHRKKDGTIFPVEITAAFFERKGRRVHLATIRDITERRRAEEEKTKLEDQLRQSQKLEAIGQLAGGVAHDFNNLLGGIMGSAELIKMHEKKDTETNKYADRIIHSTTKAADLTRQLLTFARKARVNFTQVEICGRIENVIELLRHSIDRKIEIITKFMAGPCFIQGDSNMLENALLNIAINARDAMPRGGTLTFTTSNEIIAQNTIRSEGDAIKPGSYICVAITDTGTGMDKETQKRIFEPFFTTKEAGKGTGLGLAAVYGCVRQHNGYINVDSEIGAGTTFTIYLPESSSAFATEVPDDSVCVKGTGTILIIDDEQVIGDTLREILKDLGYSPEVFCDPLEAMEYFGKNHGTIAVVVLDLIMPKMSGLDLFRAFKKLDPGVKVVVASGYSDNNQEKLIMQEGAKEFVEKPYRARELSKALARVVGESAQRG